MKTRQVKEIVEVQDGGCCGPAPKMETTAPTSCCGTDQVQEEKPVASGGCCG
ncbi:hypothetical protein [Flagellimonas sp.]|uniref:hypothetical protein n=1 Tax=Flagellimonas sp. TaxID=2058762 RepID=UPI003B5D01C5